MKMTAASALAAPGTADAGQVELRARVMEMPFEQLYDEHVDMVFRATRRFGVSDGSIEDAVQEVFIVAFKRREAFEGKSSISSWLYGITAHVARNFKRTVRRHPESPAEESVFETQHANDAGPEKNAEDAEAARTLYAILDELDDDKREAFVLAELEELSAPEIAASLELNVNTVYARIRAARAAFEQAVARHRARHDRRVVPCR